MKRELKWTLRPEKYIQYERKKKKTQETINGLNGRSSSVK